MPKDFYAVLGVARNATADQIRQRFKELARDRHPDRVRGAAKAEAEVAFQEITEAFNVLSNPERRRAHDLELARPDSQPAQAASRAQLAKIYLQRGIAAYREKNYLAAAENFDRATKAEPQNPQAWHHLALACTHQERWLPQAKRAIVKACELRPMEVVYLKLAGKIFARTGEVEKAETFYNQALSWGGEDETIRQALEELKRARKGRSRFFGRTGG